jgi:MFS family permease
MFGPFLGGQLGEYGMHVPFLAAAGLSMLSMICTYTLLPHEAAPGSAPTPPVEVEDGAPPPPSGRRPGVFDVAVYTEYFRRPGLANLYLQFFLFSFAFSCFMSGFALFAHGRFGWGPREVGRLFAYSGFLGIILQGGLMGRLVKRFGEAKLTISGFVAVVIAYALLGVIDTLALLMLTATISAYGNGVLRPVITSSLTQAVGRHEQGVALGISQSLGSVAMILAPAVSGELIEHGWLMAWAFMAAGVSVLGFGAAMARRRVPAH